jgi:hypothetical protein
MTVVTQLLAQKRFGSGYPPLLPFPVWQVSPSTVLLLHNGQCLLLLIFVIKV